MHTRCPPSEFAARRAALFERIGPHATLLLLSGQLGASPYREEENFFYLTGLTQPGAAIAMLPASSPNREILYWPPAGIQDIISGPTPTPDDARKTSGIALIQDAGSLPAFLQSLRRRAHELWMLVPPESSCDQFARELAICRELSAAGTLRVRDATDMLLRQRLVKSEYEIKAVERAVEISRKAFSHAFSLVREQPREHEVWAAIEYEFLRAGGRSAFPPIVAAGRNALVLHHAPGATRARRGSLLLIDAGSEWNHYCADVSRTVPVSGTFSKEQAKFYDLVHRAQHAAIQAVRAGNRPGRYGTAKPDPSTVEGAAIQVIESGLQELGLIHQVRNAEYRAFMPHPVCHHIGLNVHEGRFCDDALAPNMLLAVEAGLYIPTRKIGIRLEDVVLVTAGAPRVLSASIPRSRYNVQRMLRARMMPATLLTSSLSRGS